jgi:hypothetical protein
VGEKLVWKSEKVKCFICGGKKGERWSCWLCNGKGFYTGARLTRLTLDGATAPITSGDLPADVLDGERTLPETVPPVKQTGLADSPRKE